MVGGMYMYEFFKTIWVKVLSTISFCIEHTC